MKVCSICKMPVELTSQSVLYFICKYCNAPNEKRAIKFMMDRKIDTTIKIVKEVITCPEIKYFT